METPLDLQVFDLQIINLKDFINILREVDNDNDERACAARLKLVFYYADLLDWIGHFNIPLTPPEKEL